MGPMKVMFVPVVIGKDFFPGKKHLMACLCLSHAHIFGWQQILKLRDSLRNIVDARWEQTKQISKKYKRFSSYGGMALWILKIDLHLYKNLRNSWMKTANSLTVSPVFLMRYRCIWCVCLSWIWKWYWHLLYIHQLPLLYFVLKFSCNGFLWPGLINSPWTPCFLPKIKFCVVY